MTFKNVIEDQIKTLERKRDALNGKPQLNTEDSIALSNLNGKIYGLKSALITFETIQK